MEEDKKYIVFRLDELTQICTHDEFMYLNAIINRVIRLREQQGLPQKVRYYVLSEEDSDYDNLVEIIQKLKA